MIVACLGLFALSAFMIEQRGKEISIRLLFGATVQKIFDLLTADFLKLILDFVSGLYADSCVDGQTMAGRISLQD